MPISGRRGTRATCSACSSTATAQNEGAPLRLLILGLGYTATRVAAAAGARGARIAATTRDGRGGTIAFADAERLRFEIAAATHILSSIPPIDDADPVLDRWAADLRVGGAWLGYLSSTGVYGDTRGAWVDEDAPMGTGRRSARAAADAAWLGLGGHVFRLPGIYGPGRSALDRVPDFRVDAPGQVFSRIHVDDIASGVLAGFHGPAGAYNLADDLPAPQADVIAYACALIGRPPPPLLPLAAAPLSPAARAFYSENRRVANGRARRLLGWRPRYGDYRLGLRALSASTSPASTSAAPAPASHDQR